MKKIYLFRPLANYRAALALIGAPCVDSPARADVLLLPGGGDLAPALYGQENCGASDIDPARDARELALLRDFVRGGRQVLGICRGLQVVNVFFGGTLSQHIDGHNRLDGQDRLHAVTAGGLLRALYGGRFFVNSAHHQSIDRLGSGLRVLARADDGTVEAITHEALPVFAVQWHPERLCGAFSRPDVPSGALLLDALLR